MDHRAPADIVAPLDTVDVALAVGLGAAFLLLYLRTLAPDVLYSDSAEFQTLAYTLGITHTTGYPVYLLIARAFGALLVGTPAWRVNLVSAVSAAAAVSVVTLLAGALTPSRIGALLAGVLLGLSYTFWSQAVIAEVYAPALAGFLLVLYLLWQWSRHANQPWRWLFPAAWVTTAGLGIHASVGLLVPAAVIFVSAIIIRRRGRFALRRTLLAATVGTLTGLMIFVGTFWWLDQNNPPSSFFNVTMVPSRSIWDLSMADLDTFPERFWITLSGLQWRHAMFPKASDRAIGLVGYVNRLRRWEFTTATLVCALIGAVQALRRRPALGALIGGAGLVALTMVLNYHPPDWHIFYLPTYALVALLGGAGAG